MEHLAVFDFDGTITRHDSFPRFLLHAYSGRRMRLLLLCLPLIVPIILAKLRLASPHKVKERVCVSLLGQFSQSELNVLCRSFARVIDRDINPDIKERMVYHRRCHHTIIIISASLKETIHPWARRNKVNNVLATDVKLDDDNRICGFASMNCNGIEKVRRLKAFLVKERSNYFITAYGNSTDDYPLLRYSDKSYLLKHSFWKNECHVEDFN